jgi:2-dehydro-3-deoxygalactonokinase
LITSPIYIAIDWGTSHFRAYLCNADKQKGFTLLEQRVGPSVVKVNKKFEQTLIDIISPWIEQYGNLPIYMSGQITSSIGWHETPYLECPFNPENLLREAVNFDCKKLNITALPGSRCRLKSNLHDVMRGEELQVLGFLKHNPQYQKGEVLLCLPGTHTKWVLINNSEILCFKTAMTGELYNLLCHQSVLIPADCEDGDFDWKAFEEGCKLTLSSDSGNLTHGIFSVRTRQLSKELTPLQAKAYLSGVLIGSDVRAARHASEWQLLGNARVVVIGTNQLNKCFVTALKQIDVKCVEFDIKTATLSGFNYLYNLENKEVKEIATP